MICAWANGRVHLHFTNLYGGTTGVSKYRVTVSPYFPIPSSGGRRFNWHSLITLIIIQVLHILLNLFYLCYSFAFSVKVNVDGA
jgi:putative exporter of polyketide antibiotics